MQTVSLMNAYPHPPFVSSRFRSRFLPTNAATRNRDPSPSPSFSKTLHKPYLSSSAAASTSTSTSTSTSSTPAATLSANSLPTPRKSAVSALKDSADLLATLARFENVLLVQDLNIVLRYFGNLGRWSEVSQLFDWMVQHGKVNIPSYSGFIKYAGKSRNHLKALQVYSNLTNKSIRNNVAVCNSILGCLIKNDKFESTMKLYDQMRKDGLQTDLVTYSTLLAGCSKQKDSYSRAMQLINELLSSGLHMDGVIYGTLLSICASNNLCEEAESFFQQMKAEGLTPNIFHYSSLLNVYSVDGDYLKAENLLKEVKSAGIELNKVILSTLLKVYVRGGLFEKAKELLAELESSGLAEAEMPYCLLMDGLAKAGHIQEAKAIFDDMIRKNVKSDGYCYSIMISAFCRSRLLEDAKKLAIDFEVKFGKYDLVMLNTLLRAYCNMGDMESAMQMLKKMDELAISPDWNTFHILIKYFCKEKLYHLAYRTVEDMHNKGHRLDEELCFSLIIQLSQNEASAEAFGVYNMLRYSKRTVRKSLHEKMLNILVRAKLLKDAYVIMKDNAEHISDHTLRNFALSYMKSGNVNMINDVVKAMSRAGRKIDQEIFGTAIARYISKPEKKDLLLQFLQWMTGQGHIIDSSSRNLLLKNSDLFDQKHVIAEILSKQHAMSRKANIQDSRKGALTL